MKPKPAPSGDKHRGTGTAAFQLGFTKRQSRPPGRATPKREKSQPLGDAPRPSPLPLQQTGSAAFREKPAQIHSGAQRACARRSQGSTHISTPLPSAGADAGAGEQTHPRPHTYQCPQPPRPTRLLPAGDPQARPRVPAPSQDWVGTQWAADGVGKSTRIPDLGSCRSSRQAGCPAFWVPVARELFGDACSTAGSLPAPSKDHLLHQRKQPGIP